MKEAIVQKVLFPCRFNLVFEGCPFQSSYALFTGNSSFEDNF
jgi:hypothetical protein